jgi:DME family drug/metabolite transporter
LCHKYSVKISNRVLQIILHLRSCNNSPETIHYKLDRLLHVPLPASDGFARCTAGPADQIGAIRMAGLLLVGLAAILWGTVGVATNLMTAPSALDPALAGLSRTALGAASLLAAAAVLRLPRARLGRRPLLLLGAFALAGAVFQCCLFAAFAEVGVTVTVAVTVCAPVALVAGGQAIRRRAWPEAGVAIAIALASAGVLTALLGAGGDWTALHWRGVMLLGTASVAFALLAASASVLSHDLHPLRAAGLGLAATAGALAILLAARRDVALTALGTLSPQDLAILAYTGVAGTGGAYLAFVLGLSLSRSAACGIAATLIEPGVAALLAALVLRERLAPHQAAGCALMLAAMVILFAAERRIARTLAATQPEG